MLLEMVSLLWRNVCIFNYIRPQLAIYVWKEERSDYTTECSHIPYALCNSEIQCVEYWWRNSALYRHQCITMSVSRVIPTCDTWLDASFCADDAQTIIYVYMCLFRWIKTILVNQLNSLFCSIKSTFHSTFKK